MRLPRLATAYFVASLLLVSGAAGCSSDDDEPSASGTIVIGADLNNSSSVDTAYARALQLRIEQVNASGVLGDRKLLLRTQDNRSDPTSALRNIGAFADDPNVAAVVTGSCDECVTQAAKTINDKKIPTISLAASDQVADPVDQRRFIFKIGPNSSDSTTALANELGRLKVSSASILYSADLYGRGSFEKLRPKLTEAKVKFKSSRQIKPGADDLTQTVGSVVDNKPAALVVLAGPDQATIAATAARAAGFKGRVFFDAAAAGDLFVQPDAVSAVNDATMVFTQTLAIDDVVATTPAKAARKQWFRDYTSRYGSYSGVAAFAADATDVIAAAVGRAGTNRDQIRDIIETSQIDGLSGPIRITPDNHSGLMPQALTLLVARSGQWRLSS